MHTLLHSVPLTLKQAITDPCFHRRLLDTHGHVWATSTKQLLNTGGGDEEPRKAAHSLQKEVGQNIKDKKRDERVRDGDPPQGGSYEEVSKHQETLSLVGLWGVLESQRAT